MPIKEITSVDELTNIINNKDNLHNKKLVSSSTLVISLIGIMGFITI